MWVVSFRDEGSFCKRTRGAKGPKASSTCGGFAWRCRGISGQTSAKSSLKRQARLDFTSKGGKIPPMTLPKTNKSPLKIAGNGKGFGFLFGTTLAYFQGPKKSLFVFSGGSHFPSTLHLSPCTGGRIIPSRICTRLITMAIVSPLSMAVSLPNGRTSWLKKTGVHLDLPFRDPIATVIFGVFCLRPCFSLVPVLRWRWFKLKTRITVEPHWSKKMSTSNRKFPRYYRQRYEDALHERLKR